MRKISITLITVLAFTFTPQTAQAADCAYGSALDVNVMTGVQTITCMPAPTAEDLVRKEQEQQFRQEIQVAQKEAENKSQTYSAANPGEQKCFNYEVIYLNGSYRNSGSVCANSVVAPVAAPVAAPTPSTATVARIKAAVKPKPIIKKKAKIVTKRRNK